MEDYTYIKRGEQVHDDSEKEHLLNGEVHREISDEEAKKQLHKI